MVSLAEEWQEALEARGEYVVKANVGFFAVFPSTWQQRTEAATRDGRDGPNLVIFRNRSNNRRDHHVIPYSIVQPFLVAETLTVSRKDGSKRWNLTVKDEQIIKLSVPAAI
jgi:hypothetical protein